MIDQTVKIRPMIPPRPAATSCGGNPPHVSTRNGPQIVCGATTALPGAPQHGAGDRLSAATAAAETMRIRAAAPPPPRRWVRGGLAVIAFLAGTLLAWWAEYQVIAAWVTS